MTRHGDPRHENRLINETSPYLLQHARNPVDWYPWGEAAFEKARTEGKPIFLSIGYSTCHWCHVMERESFEDEATAAILNEHFVAIKVDREERPDIDAAYMSFVVATTGSGGWPLNVFCTSTGKPFFGGTYFPPRAKFGMASFKDILVSIIAKHASERGTIEDAAARIAGALQQGIATRRREAGPGVLDATPVEAFNEAFLASFDTVNGGSHGAPKFPITLEILCNLYQQRNVAESLFTLRKMGDGGIFDHVGGGFHRYSVDERWLVPHFEKMLYDNALLLDAFSQAYLLSGDAYFKEKATAIFTYVTGSLLGPDGFYSAQDADSEGEEGTYYVFSRQEIEHVVEHPRLFCEVFNVTRAGNFEGRNVLHVREGAIEKLAPGDRAAIAADLARLAAYRAKRVPPATDTKVVTAWNGLMISALVRFATACGVDEAMTIATRLGTAYMQAMAVEGRAVTRIAGKDGIHGFLEDHAALASAFIDLHEATFDVSFLEAATRLVDRAIEEFHEGDGYLAESGTRNEVLFARDTRVHDAVVPSGVSLLLLALLKLDAVAPDPTRRALLEQVLLAHHPAMATRPLSMALMVLVLHGTSGAHASVAVPRAMATPDTVRALHRLPAFNKTLHVSDQATSIVVCARNTCKEATDAGHAGRIVAAATGA